MGQGLAGVKKNKINIWTPCLKIKGWELRYRVGGRLENQGVLENKGVAGGT